MEIEVAGLADLRDRVEAALDRIGELQAGTRVQSDAFFSDPFVADHTEFDSFQAFRAQGPWTLDGDADLRDVSRERLDAYVAARTDFETWEEMKTRAAEERIVDQVVS